MDPEFWINYKNVINFLTVEQKKVEQFILGCSGGPDSIFLLSLILKEKKLKLPHVVHVNYHIYPESNQPLFLIKTLQKKHNFQLSIFNFDGKSQQVNFEKVAREFRFDCFAQLINSSNKKVLLAHHQDDLIITYLIQKKRNILPSYYGLKKSSQQNKFQILHPLLNFHKKKILLFLDENKIAFFIDPTNKNTFYLRNKITLDYKSNLEDPLWRKAILNTIKNENIKLKNNIFNANKFLSKNCFSKSLKINNLKNLKIALQILILRTFIESQIEEQINLYQKNLLAILDFLNIKKSCSYMALNNKYLVLKIFQNIFVVKRSYILLENNNNSKKILLDINYDLGNNNYFDLKNFLFYKNKLFATPLYKYKNYKLDLNSHHKTLNKYFLDYKVPAFIRNILPVFNFIDGSIDLKYKNLKQIVKYKNHQVIFEYKTWLNDILSICLKN